MSEKNKGNNAQDTQLARFAETARALGCDEDEAAFDEKLKVIARQKPREEPKLAKRPRRKSGSE